MVDMTSNDADVSHIIIIHRDFTVMRHVLQMTNRGHCRTTRKRKWQIICLFHITTAELHLNASRNIYKYLNVVLLHCDYIWCDVFSTAGKRQKTAARGARVPSSQSETEKNHSVGFRGVKRMLNSLQCGPTQMFRIKANGPVKVSVLVLFLYAAYICQEYEEFKIEL